MAYFCRITDSEPKKAIDKMLLPLIFVTISLINLSYCEIKPFDLNLVTISDNTVQAKLAEINREYLLGLHPDRLLWVFRQNANLPTPGTPFEGSWEDPNCELRGHFVGHYLSAIAFVYKHTGNTTADQRLRLLVEELRKVQLVLGGGYLSAFPDEHFDRVEDLKPVWAPYYVIHKIMAGLVDAYELGGVDLALTMVSEMADYFHDRINRVVEQKGMPHWVRTLDTEFGGMNDIMFRLYKITRDEDHARMADLFTKKSFLNPLIEDIDNLPGLHANTHLAQVVGFATQYDTVGDVAARTAVEQFFEILTQHHSYATGGSNSHEYWSAADNVGDGIYLKKDATVTQETCTQYNLLKITRSLFMWTKNSRLLDFYERAFLNGILGVTRMSNEDVYTDPSNDIPIEPALAEGESDQHHHHHHKDLRMRLMESIGQTHSGHAHGHGHGRAHARGRRHKQGRRRARADGISVVPVKGKSVVPEHERYRTQEFTPWWGFQPPSDTANTTHVAGTPGVYLYMYPLSSGLSKDDSPHHWGYPEHSFWCCYGTAIESFAKLADSIYFYDMGSAATVTAGANAAAAHSDASTMPALYVAQYISSNLDWEALGVKVSMWATLYGSHSSLNASLTVTTGNPTVFSLMLRIPEWTKDRQNGLDLLLNGEAWTDCPGEPKSGSFCNVTRSWKSDDRITLVAPMVFYLKGLPENRPRFQSLKALMMGPMVMAGLTGDTRELVLPADKALGTFISEPEDADSLVSVQAAWQPDLFIRQDLYSASTSIIEDGGDAMDATFQLTRGCHGHQQEHRRETDSSSQSGLQDQAAMHKAMRIGRHEKTVVSLTSMNLPGFFLGYDEDGFAVIQHSDGSANFCDQHTWNVVPGLNGANDTLSLEATGKPGHFLSAYRDPALRPACRDYSKTCASVVKERACNVSSTDFLAVNCRSSCKMCDELDSALMVLPPGKAHDRAVFSSASSFKFASPLAPRYPPGAKVLTATNRPYLLVPLANIVDERYTAYFDVNITKPKTSAIIVT